MKSCCKIEGYLTKSGWLMDIDSKGSHNGTDSEFKGVIETIQPINGAIRFRELNVSSIFKVYHF